MVASAPRVAFFPDAFHEANGVARTSRALVATAAARGRPFLCIHAGLDGASPPECAGARLAARGEMPAARGGLLEITRGPISFAVEHDLRHDLLLWRHGRRVLDAVRAFKADVVHITGPSDIGQLGAYVAHRLDLPLVASWHTNIHEFAAWRVEQQLGFLPRAGSRQMADWIRRGSLWAMLQFYRMPSVLLAPNLELVEFLHRETGSPTYLMRRGVDTTLFSPTKRDADAGTFRFGYVGRLSSEKNVRLLPSIERALIAAGQTHFQFLIVGEGSERRWLEQQMTRARFVGVLHGEALARAYANMDLLVFPSRTDTFGNVVQEALASGTPALVTSCGGPKFIVRQGISGFVASDDRRFIEIAQRVIADRGRHRSMRLAARRQALGASWDHVFDEVVEAHAAATRRTLTCEVAAP
jgi:phosphatidylinositol alpha 1,6-mannosyltransferase